MDEDVPPTPEPAGGAERDGAGSAPRPAHRRSAAQAADGTSLAIAVTTIERPQVIQRFILSVRQYFPEIPIYVADQSRDIGAMMSFYDAHRVTVVRMPYDAGVTASRNRLVAAMGEEYFVLCDDDFVFGAETRFTEAIAILEAEPEIGVVGGKLYDFDGTEERPRHWELFFEYDRKNRLLITTPIYQLTPIAREVAGVKLYLCDAVMNFAVFRRSIFDETVRWDERFKSNGEHEDFYLNLKVNSTAQVAYLPTMTAYHHRSEVYEGYHHQLRGREQGWSDFLLKWNLQQHLEIGYGVRSIADVGTVVDAEGARQKFSLDDPPPAAPPPEAPAAKAGTAAEATDRASLQRKYALEPGAEPGGTPLRRLGLVFFRYRMTHTRKSDFSLWYRAAQPAGTGRDGHRLAVCIRWYAKDGCALDQEAQRKVLDLAEADYWKPLLVDVPVSPRPEVLRFEVAADSGGGDMPFASGFLLCDDDRAGEQAADGNEVLALSHLNPAELRQVPPANFAGDGGRGEPMEPALDVVRLGTGDGLALADIGRFSDRSLLLFKGWNGFGTSLVAVRLPDAAIEAPRQIALPAADLAGSTARLAIYDEARGAVEIPLRPEPRNAGRRRSIGAVFRGYWPGGALGPIHRACLQSFVGQGHVFELYACEPVDAGPGVVVRDAEAVLPPSELSAFGISALRHADDGRRADLVRVKLLRDAGGWWCDVGTLCATDAMPGSPYVWARDHPERQAQSIDGSLLNCPQGDPIFAELYRRCRSRPHTHGADSLALLSELLTELGLPLDVGGSRRSFHPLPSIETVKLWLPDFADEVAAACATAVVIPLHASRMREIGIDFSVLPPTGSFLAKACDQYSIDAPDAAPRYTTEEIVGLFKAWLLDEMEWAIPALIAASGEPMLEYLGLLNRSTQ